MWSMCPTKKCSDAATKSPTYFPPWSTYCEKKPGHLRPHDHARLRLLGQNATSANHAAGLFWWTNSRTRISPRSRFFRGWRAKNAMFLQWEIPTRQSTASVEPQCGIRSFSAHFPGVDLVELERNRRSTSPILNCAFALISKNPKCSTIAGSAAISGRSDLRPGGRRGARGQASCRACRWKQSCCRQRCRVHRTSRGTAGLARKTRRKWSDCAVLYRTIPIATSWPPRWRRRAFLSPSRTWT